MPGMVTTAYESLRWRSPWSIAIDTEFGLRSAYAAHCQTVVNEMIDYAESVDPKLAAIRDGADAWNSIVSASARRAALRSDVG